MTNTARWATRASVGAIAMIILGISPNLAKGQQWSGGSSSGNVPGPYDAPGYYGTYYGSFSYGIGQTYTQFGPAFGTSSHVPGVGIYATPYGFAQQPYQPGQPNFGLGPERYGVWAVPGTAADPNRLPSFGSYAPVLGPNGSWYYPN